MIRDVNPYATYESLTSVSYKIVEHLMTSPDAEIIWKLLKYNDANAYSRPNLSLEEKAKLIYNGEAVMTDYNVFFDYMMDDAEDKMQTLLRIYPAEVYPTNRTTGICMINIEVFTHSHINHLSNYTTRVDVIIQTLLKVLNGADVGGVGVLFFDNQGSRYDRIQTIGQKPYKGKLLKMSVNMG
jgi:hypothetical protein|nr:MAG TPA: hypothetical protein [Caudoviricetes sp.]